MAIDTRANVKANFQNTDIPNQGNFEEFIDSAAWLGEANDKSLTSGGTDDFVFKITATLNDSGAAGGSDVFRALYADVTETDSTGWDETWFMQMKLGGSVKFQMDLTGATTFVGSCSMQQELTFNNTKGMQALESTNTTAYAVFTANADDSISIGNSTGWTSLRFFPGSAEIMRIDAEGVLIGTTTVPGGTTGKALIFGDNGGNPTVSTSQGGVFCKDVSGTTRVFVVDNIAATQISPHDDEGQWVFYSENLKTGRKYRVKMEGLIDALVRIHPQLARFIEDSEGRHRP